MTFVVVDVVQNVMLLCVLVSQTVTISAIYALLVFFFFPKPKTATNFFLSFFLFIFLSFYLLAIMMINIHIYILLCDIESFFPVGFCVDN